MQKSLSTISSEMFVQNMLLLMQFLYERPLLNCQGWRHLEYYIREWTNERGELYVVTGAIFEGEHEILGNVVHVPTHFYKMVFDPGSQDAITFLVPHRPLSKGELPAFIVSVDEIERRTGLDFNNLLDDTLEDDIEEMW